MQKISKWPVYEQNEISAATEVLRSGKVNYWTGNKVKEFEIAFANYHSVKHAIAVSNGTVAIELALRALGIGTGDEVIVSPRSFLASASVILQVGATPIFADINLDTQNLDPEEH